MIKTFAKRGLLVLLGLASLTLVAVLISSVFGSIRDEPLPLESSSSSSSVVQPQEPALKSALAVSVTKSISPLRLGVVIGAVVVLVLAAIAVAIYFMYFAAPEPVAEPIVKDTVEDPEIVEPTTDQPVLEQTNGQLGRMLVGVFSGLMFCSFVVMMAVLANFNMHPTSLDYIKLGVAFVVCLIGIFCLFGVMLFYPQIDSIGMIVSAGAALLLLSAIFFSHGQYKYSMGSFILGLISIAIWLVLSFVI